MIHFFGPELKVELFAVEENDQVPESKFSEQHVVICICGEKLVCVPVPQAYNGGRVSCNVCNKSCSSEEVIFHCPRNRNSAHGQGYDMCSSCVAIQMQSMVSSTDDKNKPNNEDNKNHVDNENKNDDFIPILSVNSANVNEIENNNQNSNVSPKNSEPELIEMEDISDNENENNQNKEQHEDDKFEFKSQLNSLKEMGFNDIETFEIIINQTQR